MKKNEELEKAAEAIKTIVRKTGIKPSTIGCSVCGRFFRIRGHDRIRNESDLCEHLRSMLEEIRRGY